MKKYLVIGNPIQHSLSPKLHNHWIKKNNINAIYEKKQLTEIDLEEIISELREDKISGINVTIPFKVSIIPFIDELSLEAKEAYSVNTIYKENNKILGHNTDITGFELAIKKKNYDVKGKKIFILGAGGVVSSIILALRKMKVAEITLSNRTKEKTERLKNIFSNLKIVDWGEIPEFNMIINATSLGLKKDDKINLDFSKVGKKKLFYDLIYNPEETNFLKIGKELGSITENGKLMFIYQAQLAFEVWHGIKPKINDKVIKLLRQ